MRPLISRDRFPLLLLPGAQKKTTGVVFTSAPRCVRVCVPATRLARTRRTPGASSGPRKQRRRKRKGRTKRRRAQSGTDAATWTVPGASVEAIDSDHERHSVKRASKCTLMQNALALTIKKKKNPPFIKKKKCNANAKLRQI